MASRLEAPEAPAVNVMVDLAAMPAVQRTAAVTVVVDMEVMPAEQMTDALTVIMEMEELPERLGAASLITMCRASESMWDPRVLMVTMWSATVMACESCHLALHSRSMASLMTLLPVT